MRFHPTGRRPTRRAAAPSPSTLAPQSPPAVVRAATAAAPRLAPAPHPPTYRPARRFVDGRVDGRARDLIQSLEPRLMLSVSKDANGFTVVTPTAASRVIYVAAGASDTTSGLSPGAATSLTHGLTLIRNGSPDQLLLRRGDSFSTSLGGWAKSGPTAADPMVIGAYTDPARPSADRPKILSGISNGFSTVEGSGNVPVSHLYILGVAFEANQRNFRQPPANFTTASRTDAQGGTYGIKSLGQLNDFQVEDCSFQYYRSNIAFTKFYGTFNDVRIRRNLIADAYVPNFDPATGKYSLLTTDRTSEGMYVEFVNGLTIEENVIDHNGWVISEAGGLGAVASIYNHDLYIQYNCTNVTVSGNIIANAASHGVQMRAGGVIKNNLFVDNPIAMSFGLSTPTVAGGVSGAITGNVVVGGATISGDPRGWGIEIANLRPASGGGGTTLSNNIFTTYTGGTDPAILMNISQNSGNPTEEAGLRDLTIDRNIVYGWTRGFTISSSYVDGNAGQKGLSGLVVTNNDFQRTAAVPIADHGNAYNPAYETWANNRYNSQSTTTSQWFRTQGTSRNISGWQSTIEPTAQAVQVPYPDPGRTAYTYNQTLGGTPTNDAFLAQARQQTSLVWRPQYGAQAVIDYIRAGFAGQRVDVAPPAGTAGAPALTVGGAATYRFTVTWTDDNQVSLASLGNGDVRVTGPNGYNQLATLVAGSVVSNTDGTTRTAAYTVPAPNGTAWTAADAGTYTLTTDAGQVTDPTGKSASGALGSFQATIDAAAPAASLAAAPAVANATAGQTLTVTYAAPPTAAAYSPAVLADRPAVYYRLGDPSGGTTAADASGNAHPGTYGAVGSGAYQLGVPGAVAGGDTAAGFSSPVAGDGGYVQPSVLLNTGPATVEAWIYLDAAPAGNALVAGFADGLGSGVYDKDLYIGPDGRANWYVFDGQPKTVAGPALSLGAWHHLVGTVGAADGFARLYIDGAEYANTPAGDTYVGYTQPDFFVGGATAGLGFLNGRVDEAAAYAGVLPADRVQAHYLAATGGGTSGIVQAGSLDSNDLVVSGPNGYAASPALAGASPSADGSTVTATYALAAPAGGWAAGTYNVSTQVGQVTTAAGGALAAGALGAFAVTASPPTANATATDVTAAGGASQTITVTYRDDAGINAATLDNNDLRVLGPNGYNAAAALAGVSGAGTVVTATYTVAAPSGGWQGASNGTYSVVAQSGQVADVDGNPLAAGGIGAFQVNVDVYGPLAAAVVTGVSAPATAKTITVNYVDASGTTNLGTGDITVTGPNGFTGTPAFVGSTTSGTAVTATYSLTPPGGNWQSSANGTYTVNLVAGGVTDPQGNPAAAGAIGTFSVTLDTTPPTASATAPSVTATGVTGQTITVTYADSTPGVKASSLDSSDLVVQTPAGGTLPVTLQSVSPTGDGTPRTATYFVAAPSGTWKSSNNGTYTILLQSGQVSDTAGNFTAAGGIGTFTVALETVPPTVAVAAVTPNPRNAAVSTMTVTFSEPVSGFDLADLVLSRDGGANLLTGAQTLTTSNNTTFTLGNLSGVTTANGTYVLTVTAAGSGVADLAGNALGSGGSTTFRVDTVAPTAAVTAVTPNPRNSAVPSLTVTFSEAVTGFDLSDLVLSRDGGPNLLVAGQQTLTTSNNTTFTLNNLSGLTTTTGNYTLTVTAAGSGVADQAGNAFGSGASTTFRVDTTAPTAAVAAVSPNPRNAAVAAMTVSFSEPVTGFDLADLVLSRDGGPNLLTAGQTLSTSDNMTFTLGNLAGPTATTGTYTLTVNAAGSGVADPVGNAFAAPAATTFRVDTTAPTAAVAAVSPNPRSTPVDALTITFTEAVNGVDVSDFTLSRNGGPNLLVAGQQTLSTTDGATYTLGNLAGLTGPAGSYVLTVAGSGSGIVDGVGNAFTAGASTAWTTTAVTRPTVSAVTVNDGNAQRSKVNSITVTFDQAVALGAGAVNLTGRSGVGAGTVLSLSNPTGDGRTWVITFSGSSVVGGSLADGIYDLRVVAGQVTSAASGAPMTADYAFAFHRLFSDADGNGQVDNFDLFQIRSTYLKPSTDPAYKWYFDYDGGGVVDNLDLFQIRSRQGVVFQGY